MSKLYETFLTFPVSARDGGRVALKTSGPVPTWQPSGEDQQKSDVRKSGRRKSGLCLDGLEWKMSQEAAEVTGAEAQPQVSSSPKIEEPGEDATKKSIRRLVWEHLEHNRLSMFPRPVYGRIPNFKGCEEAAAKLENLEEFKAAGVVEVNPDKPQEPARLLTLEKGKKLLVPVPRLKEGFLKHITVEPDAARSRLKEAVRRRMIDETGDTVDVNDDGVRIDLLVLGSVAVSKEGYRIGKGRGYADLEYAILREMKAVNDNTVIVTNVHDSQVFDTLPKQLFQTYDVPVDYIVTPTRVIKIENRLPRPRGIQWNILSNRRVANMSVLQKLKEQHEKEGKDVTLKETDTDVESYEPRRPNRRFKRYNKKVRPRSSGRTSESQGEGDAAAVAKPQQRRRRLFRRRRPVPAEDDPSHKENGNAANSETEQQKPSKRPLRRPLWRNRNQIDFSLLVSNIEKSVRVRDLKNALLEKGIKPNDITWRAGFCYLHYAKPNPRAKTVPEPYQVDNVIEILQNLKLSPESETSLDVKVVEPISRIETTDVTAV